MKATVNNKKPLVYIITVNWNNYPDTIDCLNSLVKMRYDHMKMVIVDNGSRDNSIPKFIEWAKGRHINFEVIKDIASGSPSQDDNFLTIISLPDNRGFAGGNNIGIRYALDKQTDYVALLNNDTVVTEDLLAKMVNTSLKEENVGMVGGKIKYFDEPERIWFSGGDFNFFRGAFYHRLDDFTGQRESDFITGCLMLIPAPVLRKVSCFDERYFLNIEDVDLSWRVKAAGYRLLVEGEAVIYHKISATIGGAHSTRNQYYYHRNRLFFFSKSLSGIKKFLFYCFQFLVAIPGWITVRLLRGNTPAVKGAVWGYFDFLRGRWGKCEYL